MFSRILVATSLSETSDHVIDCLEPLKKIGTKQIVLVHAMNIRDVGTLYNRLREMALPKLEAQKYTLEQMGFAVEAEVPLGIPYYEINKIVNEKNISAIVVHVTAESMLGDYFVGGVAHEVINRAEKPVLVFKAMMIDENAGRHCEVICKDFLANVLYPTDFSDNAEKAFAYLEKIVESGCEKVTLLHVQDKAKIDKHLKDRLEEFNKTDQARLERLKNHLTTKGAEEVSIEIKYGFPVAEILKMEKEKTFSLIVMGSQGRGFIKEVFLGSVSHNVVRHSAIPVLLVPFSRD